MREDPSDTTDGWVDLMLPIEDCVVGARRRANTLPSSIVGRHCLLPPRPAARSYFGTAYTWSAASWGQA